MLPFLPTPWLAQVVVAPTPALQSEYITQPQQIRPLPGRLNEVPVFNSNSPEVVMGDGILLSTFPQQGKYDPRAHLNQALQGRFDFFSHHIARPQDGRTLHQGVVLTNPTDRYVRVRVLQAASYLTSPDAPFVDLPSLVEDPSGRVFSGPGSRLTNVLVRGLSQPGFPREVLLAPKQTRMLFTLPINRSNARSTYLRLESDGPVYMANLAMQDLWVYPTPDPLKPEEKLPPPTLRSPSLEDWQTLLVRGRLASPRDKAPTPPEQIRVDSPTRPIYGRVAGISLGSEWRATIVDEKPGAKSLSIPKRGEAFSYPLSTVTVGTHGTSQVQSAPMVVRYPDTAYLAHGNYGVHYQLTLPLKNSSNTRHSVSLTLQTPLKQDRYGDRLFFVSRPTGQVFFRGTVKMNYTDDQGQPQTRFFHLTQRQGQMASPLLMLNLQPGETRAVTLDFLYPPDATPPQVITVKTEELYYGNVLRRNP
ncbi:MAG: DUF3370 domain-containing protein [Cyanobacteriota bacterium]|nr:DUF3370 domain-containing protein [Cyanobacteriota bacterium]